MSKFFSSKFETLEPYVPGEQPQDRKYLKLNTNESPFEPQGVLGDLVRRQTWYLNKYSDPDNRALTEAIAKAFDLKYENVLVTNGSDEALNYAFMAYCDDDHPIAFPEITYGFYPVIADLNRIPYDVISMGEGLTINYKDYCDIGRNVVLCNPNAPTGIALPLSEIEEIVRTNPDHVVIIDEAYVDFGAESAVGLISKYSNLLVVQTFSKSRSLAGARLGFIMGDELLIQDLNTLKYSTNPYNVNSMTAAAGILSIGDKTFLNHTVKAIQYNRRQTVLMLEERGFEVLPSQANFIFARADWISGEELYRRMKDKGVLIRHFDHPLIDDYNRITIGTFDQMKTFVSIVDEIKQEMKKAGELHEDE